MLRRQGVNVYYRMDADADAGAGPVRPCFWQRLSNKIRMMEMEMDDVTESLLAVLPVSFDFVLFSFFVVVSF